MLTCLFPLICLQQQKWLLSKLNLQCLLLSITCKTKLFSKSCCDSNDTTFALDTVTKTFNIIMITNLPLNHSINKIQSPGWNCTCNATSSAHTLQCWLHPELWITRVWRHFKSNTSEKKVSPKLANACFAYVNCSKDFLLHSLVTYMTHILETC